MTSRKREKGEQTSHKIIEKRRRDRINNCLAELSQTVPAAFAKQTSGKLEKAEILEMTVEYLRAIQTSEFGQKINNSELFNQELWADMIQHYQSGYNECMKEVFRFMTEVEGVDTNDSRCIRIMSYLQARICTEPVPSNNLTYGDKVPIYSTAMFPSSNRNLATNASSTSIPGVFHHPYSGLRLIHRFSPYSLPNHSNFRPSSTSNFVNLDCKSTFSAMNFQPRNGLSNNCNFQGSVKFPSSSSLTCGLNTSFSNGLLSSGYHNL
uniref:Hairy and enhancer of split-related protein HELT n=1 Tax=Euperipatoides kanangrensis TaxID=488523 RepID=S6DR04_9BILA|nr:transcription factor [Euperipatoides kanangrensis]